MMGRAQLFGATGGLAVRMTLRVEVADAPPLNG
jgi:hypothetical protein